MQATTQEIAPTNSQEFRTLLPRYHLFVINIQMMYVHIFHRESIIVQDSVPSSSIGKAVW